MRSIVQNKKECFVCGSVVWLEEHHIFGGSNRKHSEKYGLKVYLCHNHHNEPPEGVHHNKDNNLLLKKKGQQVFEDKYGHEKFMETFGRNYL